MQRKSANWITSSADFVMRGRREAMFFAALTSILPLMAWVSVAIICLVTLRKGAKEGALVLLVALIPVTVASSFFLTPLLIFENLIFSFVVVWGFACVLRYTASWNYVLEAAALTGIVIIFLVHLLIPDIQQLYVHYLFSIIKKINTGTNQVVSPAMKQYIAYVSRYLTGLQAALYLVGDLMSLLVARWLQDRLYNPGGLAKELMQIRLHWISGVAMILCVFGFSSGYDIALDCISVLFTIFMAAGISLIHSLANTRPAGKKWYLLTFYLALIIFMPFSFIPVVLLSFIDIWIDVRARIG